MAEGPANGSNGERLDSWKAIADYLKRDTATVRRWEKALGLPVRRVPGGGRSVFAFTSEIDAWLQRDPALASPRSALPRARVLRWGYVAVALAVLGMLGVLGAFIVRAGRVPSAGELRLELTPEAIIGRGLDGGELWRHVLPSDRVNAIQGFGRVSFVAGGASPAAYAIVSHTASRGGHEGGSGQLIEFGLDGELRRTFSFDDTVTFGGRAFGPPWVVTTLAVDDSGGARRVAVAGHHYNWDPSPVTILDEQWRRLGTFFHAGWVEALEWVADDRLVIAGFSEWRNGGMIGLLDASRLDGQGPEPAGTRYHCDDCPAGQPLRMVVMPRSEVNLASGWRFNRALLERVGDRLVARTIELEMEAGHADVVYEFSPALELVTAQFSDRYWDAHRMLEVQGKLDHTRAQCPDRDGPREVLVWTPQAGWTPTAVR